MRPVARFYSIAFAATHVMVAGYLARGGSFRSPSWVVLAQGVSLVPAVVAILLARRAFRQPLGAALALRVRPNRWFVVAWLLPLVIVVATLVIALSWPGVRWDPTLATAVERAFLSPEALRQIKGLATRGSVPPLAILFGIWMLSSVTLSLLVGCGEELGWRGFVYGKLRTLGFWRCAAGVGLLWFLWHAPFVAFGYNYPHHRWAGLGLMFVHLMLASVAYAYVRERSGSSVAAGLMHGSFNAGALIAFAPLAGGSELSVGVGSASWCAAVGLAVAGLLTFDRFVAREPIAFPRYSSPPMPPRRY